jgi:hypothetical protein
VTRRWAAAGLDEIGLPVPWLSKIAVLDLNFQSRTDSVPGLDRPGITHALAFTVGRTSALKPALELLFTAPQR